MSDYIDDVSGAAKYTALLVMVMAIFSVGALSIKAMIDPAAEGIRHDTFKQSQAYIDGAIINLQQIRREYAGADSTHRTMLVSMVQSEIDRIPDSQRDKLPSSLSNWIKTVTQ